MNELYLNKILNIKAEDGLKNLEEKSIDLVVTSPPYDDIRRYIDDKKNSKNNYKFDIDLIIKELYRVMKRGGVIVWVVNDSVKNACESTTSFRQAIKFVNYGFKLYDTMIFEKINYKPFNHKRYEQAFEYIFVFTKGKPKTTNMIMKACKFAGKNRTSHTYRHDNTGILSLQHTTGEVNAYKIKSNIFRYVVGNPEKYSDIVKREHEAKFPLELARDQILTWSNEGDVVLDIFSGSGTTAIASILTDRNYIGFEKTEKHTESSNKNIRVVEEKIKDNDLSILKFKDDLKKIKYKNFDIKK